jgi:WD40 repeat protein
MMRSGPIVSRVCLWATFLGLLGVLAVRDDQALVVARSQAQARSMAIESDTPLAVAFSGDGKLMAAAGLGKKITVWEAMTGRLRFAVPSPAGAVRRAIAFSPDSKFLAAGGDDRAVHLIDVATGQVARTFANHAGWLHTVAFSADGKQLACASNSYDAKKNDHEGDIKLWEVKTGKEQRSWRLTGETAWRLAFVPGGKELASAEGAIRWRDLETGAVTRTFKPERGKLMFLAFTPDAKAMIGGGGHWIAVGGGTQMIGAVRLWDLGTNQVTAVIDDLRPWLRSIALSPDGTLLATGTSGPIQTTGAQSKVTSEFRLWEVPRAKLVRTVPGRLGDVSSIAFAPDGRSILSCDDEEVVLTETFTGLRRSILMTVTYGTKPRGNDTAPKALSSAPRVKLSEEEVERLWRSLADADAALAFRAMGELAGVPDQAAALLGKRLLPAEKADAKRLADQMVQLESKSFRQRQDAFRDLSQLAELAEPAVTKTLAGNPSEEARRRLTSLREKLTTGWLQKLRAVEVLEYIGTAEANRVLHTIAGGAPDARLTREARATLRRLGLADGHGLEPK